MRVCSLAAALRWRLAGCGERCGSWGGRKRGGGRARHRDAEEASVDSPRGPAADQELSWNRAGTDSIRLRQYWALQIMTEDRRGLRC